HLSKGHLIISGRRLSLFRVSGICIRQAQSRGGRGICWAQLDVFGLDSLAAPAAQWRWRRPLSHASLAMLVPARSLSGIWIGPNPCGLWVSEAW
ncbi:hypothetical protein LEMLEM_LOCUS6617, partial [Lemmus lemmus]